MIPKKFVMDRGRCCAQAGSNDKRFVIEEVTRALQTMADCMDPLKLMQRLLPYAAHKNPKVGRLPSQPGSKTHPVPPSATADLRHSEHKIAVSLTVIGPCGLQTDFQ